MIIKKTENGSYAIHVSGFTILFTHFEKGRSFVSFYHGDDYKCDLFEPKEFYKAWREMKCRECE